MMMRLFVSVSVRSAFRIGVQLDVDAVVGASNTRLLVLFRFVMHFGGVVCFVLLLVVLVVVVLVV